MTERREVDNAPEPEGPAEETEPAASAAADGADAATEESDSAAEIPDSAAEAPVSAPPVDSDAPSPAASDEASPVASDEASPAASDDASPAASDTPSPAASDGQSAPAASDSPSPAASDAPVSAASDSPSLDETEAADRADDDAVTQLLPAIMAAAAEAVRAKTVALPTIPAKPKEPDAKPVAATKPAESKVPPLPPDDSPTVVDMIPAFAIVDAEATTRRDAVAARYRGSRRRPSLNSYPIGAIVVAAVILLITLTVAMQLFSGSDPKPTGAGEPLFRAQTPAPPVTYTPGAQPTSPGGPTYTPGPTYVGGGGASQVVPGGAGGPRSGAPSVPTSPIRSSSVPTSAPPAQPKTGAIVGIGGKCAEVTYYGQVQLDTCNGGSAQRWTVQTDGTVRALGACLDVRNSGTAGTAVQLFECNRTAAQQWRWRTDGTLLNPNSNSCLDAENGTSTNGTRLIIWDCHGRQNQVWRLA